MSKQLDPRQEPGNSSDPAHSPDAGAVGQAAGASRTGFEGRRRLIKLGAGALPAGLSLASRPVRAWTCNTTSAWGSAQVNPSASVTARAQSAGVHDDSWTTTNWISNTAGTGSLGQPWPVLIKYTGATGSIVSTYTMGQLFGSNGPFPATSTLVKGKTLSGSTLVMDAMNAGDQFLLYMTVAKLNQMLLSSSVGMCLLSNNQDQLKQMLGGVYSPPNLPSTVWLKPDIITYLQKNYIVQS